MITTSAANSKPFPAEIAPVQSSKPLAAVKISTVSLRGALIALFRTTWLLPYNFSRLDVGGPK
jgi:hypothetical protein